MPITIRYGIIRVLGAIHKLYGKKFKDPATVIECSDGYFFEHSNSKSGKIVCDYGDFRSYQKN